MEDLNQLLKRVTDAGIEFVIIGGYAGVLHGSSLVTRDVDILADLKPETVVRLRKALKGLHACHRMSPARLSFEDHPPEEMPVKNLYLKTDLGTLDVLSQVMGLGEFSEILERSQPVELEGVTLRILCLEDLIQAKLALGRDKDLLAVKELRALAALRGQGTGP